MYQVYKLRGNDSVTLSLLSPDPERKIKCYNGYFSNEHMFHTKEYRQGKKTHNNRLCVKGLTSNQFEVNYYGKLKKVIALQYHSVQNKVFLFK
jgi:hypothetical protein